MTSPQKSRTLRQITQLGLEDFGADAEVDVIRSGDVMCEFYRLSAVATAESLVATGIFTTDHAEALVARVDAPDFLSCGFTFIGAWGRRPIGVAG